MAADSYISDKRLGNHDAMVVMRTKEVELAFVLNKEMPKEVFLKCCEALYEDIFRE